MTGFSLSYKQLDHPKICNRIFHPRSEYPGRPGAEDREDFLIPVDSKVMVGASFHRTSPESPTILFFHGNGEIVSDYDDIGRFFTRQGVNLFVADYRGYGSSTGTPTVSAMMDDCHRIFDFVQTRLKEGGYNASLIVMGRSLGSASAIELAARRPGELAVLIVESGFADGMALLRKLGIDTRHLGISAEQGFGNLNKISGFNKPCLIIHAQFDHIIPFSDGQALYDACPSSQKELLMIEGANHNDIFIRGMGPYMERVKAFCHV